jgi:hypothetical protein
MKLSLQDTKVGDFVAVCGGASRDTVLKSTVVKATATQIVISDGRRFIRRNGKEHGSSGSRFFSPWLRPWDEEEMAEREAATRLREARYEARERMNADFQKLSLEQCEQVIAICAKATKGQQ